MGRALSKAFRTRNWGMPITPGPGRCSDFHGASSHPQPMAVGREHDGRRPEPPCQRPVLPPAWRGFRSRPGLRPAVPALSRNVLLTQSELSGPVRA